MPQSTNLNKSPYFDDFDEDKNYYKVLFKPGTTVQARELTTLQSILQNQIEKFGNKFFNNGGMVIPGGFNYDPSFNCVEVETFYKGLSVEDYFENLIGKEIQGKNTGIKAKVVKVLSNLESERETTTLYVTYLNSSDNLTENSFITSVFDDGEELITLEDIQVGESFIFANSEFARVLSLEGRKSTSIASAAKINSGIYFIRGYFVTVNDDILILDQYSNRPSYRVGFEITEEVINSNEDSSLNDNAQGFSNFAAPGADRLKISISLIKKGLEDFNDENFIELFRVIEGSVRFIKTNDQSAFINDILARRTFDESGNYHVNPFSVELVESLDNNLGNKGYLKTGQKTPDGSTASVDLGLLKVSPGKAYVKGYEVTAGNVLVDYPKPRTTATVESSSTTFYGGDLIRINNVKNIPNVGLTTTFSVSLHSRRLVANSSSGLPVIGVARAYDIESHNTAYQDPSSQFNLYLFDIQTYTVINLSATISTIIVGSIIRGKNSGAFGYVRSINSTEITLYQVSGKFQVGERVSVDEIDSNRTISSLTDYSIDDVRSISNSTVNFASDSVLSKTTRISGPFTVTTGSGTGTLTIDDGSSFASNLKVNDIIRYSRSGISSAIFVGITSIFTSKNKVNFQSVSTVENVCSSNIGVSTTYEIQNISVIRPQIVKNPEDSSLYSKLNHSNIEEVKTVNSNIYTKVKYDSLTKSGTTLTLPNLSGDYTYAAFDEERYIVVNANGSIENLSNATFIRTNGNKSAQFTSLSATAGPCSVLTTQIKSNVTPKFKKWNRCSSIDITNTKFSVPRNAGLAYTSIYGTRVEDTEISLNSSDIVEVHAIFESSTTSSPTPPWIALTNLNSASSTTNDLILGELVVGKVSGAVAVYCEKKTDSQIFLVYKNEATFSNQEAVEFVESGYTATVSSVNVGDKNIISDFKLDNGQRKQYYDFGRVIRKNNSKVPSARLTIYFDNFSFESTDFGDIITADSYPKELYGTKIPKYLRVRNTDTIDIRPRVTSYNAATKLSPFDFNSRNFSTVGANSVHILASNEDFIFDYDYYLPRVDKLVLDREGNFSLTLGEPKEVPVNPEISTEVLDVATIIGSPYVYNVSEDVSILLTDNKRFTMKDIRNLENRISNLEELTSLSLLEIETQDLLVEDKDGLNRFKSGFFVDDFSDYILSDIDDVTYRAQIENNTLSAIQNEERIDLSLYSNDSPVILSEINLQNTDSTNLKLTGNSLTINYTERLYTSQNFASRIINVNPYSIVSWTGNLSLNPSSDTWSVVTTRTRNVPNVRLRGTTEERVRETRIEYIRSRNIAFTTTRLKPNTRFKLLFDSYDMSDSPTYAFPKLLEVTNVSGTFIVGETVIVDGGEARFRICTPNHKSGPHNSPRSVYQSNPYNPSVGISTLYGPQSTILNVDIESLQISNISTFYGNVRSGSRLVGQTSKAQATVRSTSLISDNQGTLEGSIFIPNPDTSPLKFNTGRTPVTVTQFKTIGAPGEIVSSANAVFTSEGTAVNIRTINYYDPVAQSFIVEDESGIVPSSVDVYFASKDASIPVTLQIREVINGIPGGPDRIVGNLEKVLTPDNVNISTNGSKATTFTFDDLTRLEGGREYAIVLLSDSFNYNVWISRLGETEISTINNPEIEKIIINKQPSLGSFFISQNGTTWTPVQTDDLKFRLKRCQFSTDGATVKLYNSKVETFFTENLLQENPIFVGVGSTAPNDGNYMLVSHPNHGMHSGVDKVEIRGVISDTNPIKLTVGYGITSSGAISVASTSTFELFEGNPVAESNPGYIIVNNEIIRYNGFSGSTLIGITRGVDDTNIISHPVNSLVYKYEFNNVSLRRINRLHTVSNSPEPTIDSYYVQIPAGPSFSASKFGGGSRVYASKNKPYSSIELNSNFINISNKTSVSASIRSISATSVNGDEISFDDLGFSPIEIIGENRFRTLRMIASKVNETEYLNPTEFIGSKSLTLELNLDTTDNKVSPIININEAFLVCKNYRINQPINLNSYQSNSSVNSNLDDPHSFIHISERIDLQESANSLKVIFDANRPSTCDFRVLYKIFRNDSPAEDQVWEFFPGFKNLDVNFDIKDEANNDGRSDANVPSNRSGEFSEYTYTINDLPDFTGFAIKIVSSSSNQAQTPVIKKLRAIALK